MRILFDLRLSQILYNSGVGRYITGLMNAILKNNKKHDIYIILDRNMDINKPKISYEKASGIYYFQDLDKYEFKEKFGFLFLDDFLFYSKIKNINHFFDDLFPEKIRDNVKFIVSMFYDLVPLIFPKDFLSDPLVKAKYLLAMETQSIVDHFFTISESTKNDGMKYMNRPDSDFTNIYAGINPIFFNAANSNAEYMHKNRNNNIVCIMPASDIKKNAIAAVNGFCIAYNKGKIPIDAKLYICGVYKDDFIKKLNSITNLPKENIVLTGFISDDEMLNCITNAKATIFPSFYEGLGLPILESYACGTPSFASNLASMKELVLEECSFNPYDYETIATTIENIYNNEKVCIKSLEFGRSLIKEKFDWNIVAKKVLSKIEKLYIKN